MPTGIYTRRKTSTSVPMHTAKDAPQRGQAQPIGEDKEQSEVRLSAKTTRAVDVIRVTFRAFVTDFARITVSREELAPKFMKTFNQWQAESGGTFVDFIRLLVPDVPHDREGYRAHSAYQAADYLRRLVQQEARTGSTPTERAEAIRNRPVSPRVALARIVASIMPLIDPSALEALWKAMHDQLNWSDGQVAGIKTLVTDETPLVRIRAPRGIHLADHTLRLTAAPAPAQQTEETEETPRTGTHG